MSAPTFETAGDLGTETERLYLAERFREAGVSTQRFVDVEDGEKRTFDHTQREPDDPTLSGNYGIYAGWGGDESGLWLVEFDVDDYDEEGIDPDGLAAVEDISSETLAIESPHTSEENPGHRLVAVTDEDGEVVDVADALKDAVGVMNPSPTWGEVRVKNQMTVGPGSQTDPGEHGCDKSFCDECAKPYGGHYRIARNAPITTVTIQELIGTIRADAYYADTENTEGSARTQDSGSGSDAVDISSVDCSAVGELEDETVTNEAGLALDDLRERDGEEKLDVLLAELNPEAYAYPSRSEADLATASLLYHRGFETEDIARIIQHYRSYSATQKDDYLALTITKATSNEQRAFDLTDKYRPSVETDKAAPTLTVTVGDVPPSELWLEIAHDDGFQRALVRSVFNLAEGLTVAEFDEHLSAIGVDAIGGEFAHHCKEFAAGGDPWDLVRVASEFGQAQRWRTRNLHAPIEAVADGPLAVIGASAIDLPVRIEFAQEFRSRNTTYRRTVCQVIDAIAAVAADVDVTFESGTADIREWLFVHHRDDLSTLSDSVRESDVHPPVEAPLGERAREALNADLTQTHWRTLKLLETARGGEATYHELAHHKRLPVSRSRVKVVLSELSRNELVAREGPRDRRRARITAVGERAAALHDAVFGREITISEFGEKTRETGETTPDNSPTNTCTPDTSPPSPADAADRDRDNAATTAAAGNSHPIQWFSRHEHTAIAAAAPAGGVGLIDHPVRGTGTSPIASYDEDRDEFLAGSTIRMAVPGLACAARAFVEGAFANTGPLSADRLDACIDFDDYTDRLRLIHCSQTGWWSKDERTAGDLINRLRDALNGILDLLGQWSWLRQRSEDVEQLSCEILRNSQGLIGTVSWLLDECGVDFTRVFYLSEYSRHWHTSEDHRRRRSLLRSLALMTSIGSSYGAYNAYSTMYEHREEKRRYQLGAPDVDAADPTGDLLGSLVLAGKGIEKIVDPEDGPSLPDALASPGELQEDAINFAEFEVPIPVRSDRSRAAVCEAVTRMCSQKQMRPTAATISAFDGLVGSVFDITKALNCLGEEHPHHQRPIYLDEVRYALARVPADRLLADQEKPSVGKVLKASLTADEPLSQAALADRAGVTGKSLSRNADLLTALSVLERDSLGRGRGYGWRCTLPTRPERHTDRDTVPWAIDPETDTAVVDSTDRQPPNLDRADFGEMVTDLARATSVCSSDSISYTDQSRDSPIAADGGTASRMPSPKSARWVSVAASLTGTTDFNLNAGSTATIGRAPSQCGF